MINSDVLNPILLDGLTRKISWSDASTSFHLDELIETFYATRERVTETLEQVTDEQAWFASPVHPFWSISESITHLVYSQGFYHNKLLDIATSDLPHVVEAARGMGEGAKPNIPAEELRRRLALATEQVHTAIENTRHRFNPEKIEVNELFGRCNYQTWILLLLAHEIDHLRQIVAMRRLARMEQPA